MTLMLGQLVSAWMQRGTALEGFSDCCSGLNAEHVGTVFTRLDLGRTHTSFGSKWILKYQRIGAMSILAALILLH
jgi:hypothetical protein